MKYIYLGSLNVFMSVGTFLKCRNHLFFCSVFFTPELNEWRTVICDRNLNFFSGRKYGSVSRNTNQNIKLILSQYMQGISLFPFLDDINYDKKKASRKDNICLWSVINHNVWLILANFRLEVSNKTLSSQCDFLENCLMAFVIVLKT
jgi:hypothetical protein